MKEGRRVLSFPSMIYPLPALINDVCSLSVWEGERAMHVRHEKEEVEEADKHKARGCREGSQSVLERFGILSLAHEHCSRPPPLVPFPSFVFARTL